MKGRKLWLVRHGERMDHVDEIWKQKAKNPYDPPLTERGRKQAWELAGELSKEQVDVIISSPFLRCVQTAVIIAEKCGLEIKIEPGATEWLNEEWFGPTIPEWKSLEELRDQFPAIDVTYQPIFIPKHPETRFSLKERARKTMMSLTQERYPLQNILVVTHGASVEVLALGLYPKRPVDWVTYCCLTELVEQDNRQWIPTRICDTSFLSEPEHCCPVYR
ncbi:phosphoglycerate mutase family protein, putative [Galdieria sulphuraria]|uniref:Phosphoglycerate mutase family protein, putative n=1 Tax=Galdieria sulphuraria TaxID=130081 RepID=M2XEA0_GALSU|nr:phosphoglycerate mutase family protein, putative [Galdieria sulphuraria]EME28307.1 phosphoglycerate mutase family protein, putative [Galdieria sulphuraria]|eukprot:XP_005704827.1 phosphoglycerate mutase family protein, putative [Galdieria sulphuraria]